MSEIETNTALNNILNFIANESEYIKIFIARADEQDQLRYFKFYTELIQHNIKLIEMQLQQKE